MRQFWQALLPLSEKGDKEDGHGAYKFTKKPTGDILAISRIKEIHARILARLEAFGCAGQASKIKPMPLEKMAERYAKGVLNQIVK